MFPWELSRERRDDLRREIEAHPAAWVGQETVELASAPTLTSTGLEARPSVLRAFAVARQDSYSAMPGGLTRVACAIGASADAVASGRSPRISNQAGAISKDTWVLASEPEKLSGFWLASGPRVAAVDPAASMSSRAAENLFWMGRYAERAEAVLALCGPRTTGATISNEGPTLPAPNAFRCCSALSPGSAPPIRGSSGEGASDRLSSPGAELFNLVVDEDRPGTLAHAVRHLLGAAQTVRDQLGADIWMAVGTIEREIEELRTSDPDHLMVVQHIFGADHAGPARSFRPFWRGHGTRPRLAVYGRGPAPRTGPAVASPSCGLRLPSSAAPRPTACCSSRYSLWRKASSLIAAGTVRTPSSRPCSTFS